MSFQQQQQPLLCNRRWTTNSIMIYHKCLVGCMAISTISLSVSLPFTVFGHFHLSRMTGFLSLLTLIFNSSVFLSLCASLCSLLRMPQRGRSMSAAPATVSSSAKSHPRGSPVPGHIGKNLFPSVCAGAPLWDCKHTVCLCEGQVRQRKQGAAGAAVPLLRLCSQHSFHAVFSESEKEITASLEQPH